MANEVPDFDRILKGFKKSVDDAKRLRKAFGAGVIVSEAHPPAKAKPRKGSPKKKRR
jgi:hypothetical protein